MKRLPFVILIGVLAIAASCGLIFLTGPAPWATAMNIECWELLVQGENGGDDTPTTITESSGFIIVEGSFIAENWIYCGEDDIDNGHIRIYGDAAGGTRGGYVHFYTAADYDTTTDYYHMGVATASDNFQLGPPTDLDAFKMENDGTIDLTAGLKLAGTAMTSTAAELNFNDGSIAGTAVASKAVVLGASKNIDTLDIAKDGLEIGGVAVTVTAAEANFNDGATSGTAVAGKTAVLSVSKGITGLVLRNLTYSCVLFDVSDDIENSDLYAAADTGSGSVTLTLPARVSANDGRVFIFKKLDAANSLIIDGYGAETIDGVTSKTATAQYSYLQIIGDPASTTRWSVIANSGF